MAIIPDAPSLGQRNTPRPSREIASYDAGIGAKGIQQAGEAVSKAGLYAIKTSTDMQDAQDKFEAAQATLMLKEYHINKMNEYRQRPGDYAKFTEDYRAGYEKVFGEAKGLIKNPGRHQAFDLAAKEVYLSGSNDISTLGRGFQSDSYVAFGMQKAESLKAGLMANPTPENWKASRKMLETYLDSGAATGVIAADAAERTKQAQRNDLANALIESLPVPVRMKAVMGGQAGKSDPVKFTMREEIGANGQLRVHADGDGQAIGGINSEAFPEQFAEASRILRDEGQDSARIYVEGFYRNMLKERGIESLPSGVQDVVFDGVVNHRGGFQKQLIDAAKSGATRQELIDMRRAEYKRLVATGEKKYTSAATGWESRLRRLEGGGGSSPFDLPPDVVMAARGRLEAAAPQMVSEQLANAEAMAERGEAFEPIDKQLLDMAEIRSPGITAESELRLRKAKATYEMLGYSPAGMNDLLKKFEPDKANTAGYAEQSKALEALQQAAITARKKQKEETAEAAITSDNVVKTLAQTAGNSPADMKAYLAGVKEYAAMVGVAEPALLTKGMVDAYAGELTNMQGSRESRINALGRIYEMVGEENFSQVMAQIAPKTSGEILAAATFKMWLPPDSDLPTTIMNNHGVPDDVLESDIIPGIDYPKTKIEDIIASDVFTSSFADMESALIAADPSSDGRARVQQLKRQIVRAGLSYAKSGNMGIDSGIEKALASATSGHVILPQTGENFIGGDAPMIAVPAAYKDSASQIQSALDGYVGDIIEKRGVKGDYRQYDSPIPRTPAELANTIKKSAFWIALPDGKTVRLVMPTANGNIRVQDGKGLPIEATWDDLLTYKPRSMRNPSNGSFVDWKVGVAP